jgi:hypothetical protein
LGQSVTVPFRDVIGIFDLDNTTSSPITRNFLRGAEKKGQVENVSDELPKSFVICRSGDRKPKIYLSQLSSTTLRGRAESGVFMEI